jgi:uncharacterized protein YyaL (SSP411 family)
MARLAFFSLLLAAFPLVAAEPSAKDKERPANRLAKESSPYLLQHAHNPVDWYPWGEEAFAKARKEGKLIFLSIGYSSCHWCHVMEKESFADAEVAKRMNQWFVCIKVDREERPDVDHIYMTALNVMGNNGGWPLSMFLTAEGKPLIGGTYWPREDREQDGETLRGFKSILKAVHDWAGEKPEQVKEQGDRIATATADLLARTSRGIALVDLDRLLVAGIVDGLKEEYDPLYGGFGSSARKFRGTKFPQPSALAFLLDEANRSKSDELAQMVTRTLDNMARGGIYDQLGGGFHRYSTERTWTVPHFEKMLYDNAQLVELYAQAYRRTKKPLYRRVIDETLGFIQREMTSPQGGFYAALDADSSGEEGLFYVWTDKEIDALLTDKDDNALFRKVHGADERPNFEQKYHILVLPKSLAAVAQEMKLTDEELQKRLAGVRQKLFVVRAKRERPFLDTKILTAWNGQMIAGYATAGQVLEEPTYVAAAVRAADFLLKELRTKEGRLRRTYGAPPGQAPTARLNAYLDDYAFLVHGLLCLHDATGDKKWLDQAKALTDTMIEFHGEKERGGFFYTSHDHEKLFARSKDQHDGAQPAANSVALRNLLRLATKTGDANYRAMAEKGLKAFAGQLKGNPSGLPAMGLALAQFLNAQEKKQ